MDSGVVDQLGHEIKSGLKGIKSSDFARDADLVAEFVDERLHYFLCILQVVHKCSTHSSLSTELHWASHVDVHAADVILQNPDGLYRHLV